MGFAAATPALAAVEALSGRSRLNWHQFASTRSDRGFVDTDMWSFLPAAQRDESRAKVRENFPARRVGTTDDIGHAALFLMTSPYVTGSALEITGGEALVDWMF
jgi:NAD(P)-dependent dehydrogenase (short-subunit alcohol dehydrogenase family)